MRDFLKDFKSRQQNFTCLKQLRTYIFVFKNKESFQNARKNVVDGPTIVSSHYTKVDETVIDDANVESTVGYEANALFLPTIDGNMPRGSSIHHV